MRVTRHSEQRRVQRNLPLEILELIDTYGTPCHSRGALSLTLDEISIELAAEGDHRRRIEVERYRGAYIIVGRNNCVVTTARRTRRFRR